jgi:hypothetical protein
MPKPSSLTEDAIQDILSHRPDPNKKSVAQLAKDYNVSRTTIYNVWNETGTDGGRADKRARKVDGETMLKIVALRGVKDATEVAEEFMVVTRIVKKIWDTVE